MTIPRKSIRNSIYKRILDTLLDKSPNIAVFICNHLGWELKRIPGYQDLNTFDDDDNILEYFPEFARYKREKIIGEGGWWPQYDRKPRITAIKACIKLTNKVKKK
jgi:hypothetical protein